MAASTTRASSADDLPSQNERRRYRIQLFDARDRAALLALEESWNRLMADNTHLTSLFQSPQYLRFELLRNTMVDYRVAVVWEWSQRIVGVVPMAVRPVALEFAVAGRRLGALPVHCALPFGGHFIMPQEVSLYARLFAQVMQAMPDCAAILLDHLRPETELWRFATQPHGLIRRQWQVYFPEGARELNTIWLSGDFDDYLGRFSKATRDLLEQALARLRETAGGDLTLERFDGEDGVADYVTRSGRVAEHAQPLGDNPVPWSSEQDAVAQLARDGLFRSYILRAGVVDVAYCTGWQHQGVYHCIASAVDARQAASGPEAMLLYLMIRDLCQYRPATCVRLPGGNRARQQLLRTHTGFDATVLVARRTPGNLLRILSHRLFRSIVQAGRACIGRSAPREWWEATITRELGPR